jgi:WD40 repeat protein
LEFKYSSLELIKTYENHSGAINSVSLHPSGLVLTGSGDYSVHLYDYINNSTLAKYVHQSYVQSVQFLDTDKIISSSTDGNNNIFNVIEQNIEQNIQLLGFN